MFKKRSVRTEKELREEFSFEEKAVFDERLTEEEFLWIVRKVYRKKKRLSALKIVDSNVIGEYFSESNRKLYAFTISFNHNGRVDGHYLIRIEYLDDVADDWYVKEVAESISGMIYNLVRNELFVFRRKSIIRQVEVNYDIKNS